MGLFTRYVLAVISLASVANGLNCLTPNNNALEKFINSCPGLLDSSSKTYCCLNLNGDDYCCNAVEFVLNAGLGIVVPIVIAVVVIILLVSLFISCLCCSCCPWYRRRHSG